MGIRINKVLGYGLENVGIRDGRTFDPRLNADSPVFDPEPTHDIDDFVAYLEDRILDYDKESNVNGLLLKLGIMDHQSEEGPRLPAPDYCVFFDWEVGEDGVMVFVPPSSVKSNHRRDDAIDYYEEMTKLSGPNDAPENWHKVLDVPLYPHVGYMDRRTGELLSQPLESIVREMRRMKEHLSSDDKRSGLLDNLNQYWETGECNSVLAETIANAVPQIPIELVEFLRFYKVFNDELSIYELRPMVYTFWS